MARPGSECGTLVAKRIGQQVNETNKDPSEPRPTLHPPEVHTMGMGHLPLTFLVTVAISGLFALAFELGTPVPTGSLGLLVLLILFSALGPKADDSTRTAGTRFTVARVALTCLLGGLAIIPASDAPDTLFWSLAIAGIAAAGLEATDGWLARITESSSGFSERLGEMTAALLVLALSLLVWRLGIADVWVMAAGVLGFGERAMHARNPATKPPDWRVWSELALRVALAMALIPTLPDPIAPALAGLAVLIAVGQTAYKVMGNRSGSTV